MPVLGYSLCFANWSLVCLAGEGGMDSAANHDGNAATLTPSTTQHQADCERVTAPPQPDFYRLVFSCYRCCSAVGDKGILGWSLALRVLEKTTVSAANHRSLLPCRSSNDRRPKERVELAEDLFEVDVGP